MICIKYLKADRKLSALTKVAKFAPFKKGHIPFKAFIKLQFKYCPLVWMFHGRQINDKTNKLHERALRIVYNDQNILSLAIEIFKAIHNFPLWIRTVAAKCQYCL